MNILVTGGAGYIGSHTAIELLNAGHGLSFWTISVMSQVYRKNKRNYLT
ncbi:NAD-dependent epimerase/dehydratase family protein [Escherichia coli]|nr:NAD-dependent epimerase/dehydratase family protein [Escherichia coli]